MGKVSRKRGRKTFKPTKEDRNEVERGAAVNTQMKHLKPSETSDLRRDRIGQSSVEDTPKGVPEAYSKSPSQIHYLTPNSQITGLGSERRGSEYSSVFG